MLACAIDRFCDAAAQTQRKANNVKRDISEAMSFGQRLALERRRLGLQQEPFARLVGTTQAKQSLYENDRRELRADYLARLVETGVDVVFILTGQRSDSAPLSAGASELLTAFLIMPADMQAALLGVAKAMRNQVVHGAPATVHASQIEYQTKT